MLSLILPVHNEKTLITENIPKIFDHLKGKEFEILICDNGSTEFSKINFTNPKIRFLRAEKRGLGIGIKLGIDNAKYENMMFYAIDLPFGLKIIDESLQYIKDYDIVIGSKGHPQSINNHPFTRKIYSKMFNAMVNKMFHLGIKDTQGSMMFKKSSIQRYLQYLDAEDAFFQTQMLIYAKKFDQKIIEIPVEYTNVRSGKVKPFSDGKKIFKSLMRERKRLNEIN